MMRVRHILGLAVLGAGTVIVPAVTAGAMQNPTTGQPGTTAGFNCGVTAPTEPGQASSSPGSPFNETLPGNAGTRYAGNSGTASVAHAGSTAAVSQYDTACRRLSSP